MRGTVEIGTIGERLTWRALFISLDQLRNGVGDVFDSEIIEGRIVEVVFKDPEMGNKLRSVIIDAVRIPVMDAQEGS